MQLFNQLNKPKVYIPIFVIAGCLGVFLLFFIWNVHQKTDESLDAKAEYQSNIQNTKENNQQVVNDRAAIQKIKDHPKQLEDQGIAKVKKYLKIAYQQQNKSNDDIKKDYNLMLKNDISKSVRNNSEFNKIYVPKDYKLYPGTTRGASIDIYVENQGDNTQFTNDMIITYNLSSDKITNFETYRDRGDE